MPPLPWLDLAAPFFAFVPLTASRIEARRRAILREVERRPGIGVTELAARSGLGSGSFYGHLKSLAKEGRVTVRRSGKFRFVFPSGAAVPRRPAPPLRLGAKARPIAAFLAANPGLDLTAYLEHLPVERRAAYYHIQRFVREGLLTSAEPGRYVGLRPTAKLLGLLRKE